MKPESFANVPGDLVVPVDNVNNACSCQSQKRNAGNPGKDQFKQYFISFHGKQLGFGGRVSLAL
jgi:hypothetical protein